MRNIAYILDYNKDFVWVKVPLWYQFRIFTMPRSFLKRGFATTKEVEVEYDSNSAYFDGMHFKADMEIIRDVGTHLYPEASGEEGDEHLQGVGEGVVP
jgi:hypothetical protein